MPNKLTWSKPYYGVQHLDPLPSGFQITLEQYKGFTEVCVLNLKGYSPFTAISEATFPTVAEAMAWGEKKAANL